MTTTTTRPSDRGWRLGRRWRLATLVAHIVSSGAWFGLDIAMAVIVFTSIATDDPNAKAVGYQALADYIYWPIAVSGIACLATGVVLGLGTTFGLVRYWWVTVKLGLNLLLTALVLVALRPGVEELAEQGRSVAAGEVVTFEEAGIVFPPVVSSTLLLVAFLLAVFKPWGRIRERRIPGA